MTSENLYSIRMRASDGRRHVSGAERVVPAERVETIVSQLVTRAVSRGPLPDQIVVTIDSLKDVPVRHLCALDLFNVNVHDEKEGRTVASRILRSIEVSAQAIETAISHITRGAAPSGENMRGAMIIDSLTGERLEPDHERGVRASRFDWSDETGEKMDRLLAEVGLTHFRTKEALALATKAAYAPGMAAELCWSDEPDYTAGYTASLRTGYVRFPFLKHTGDPKGGRAFFVRRDGFDIDTFIKYLHAEAVLITDTGACRAVEEPDEY